MEDLLEEVVSHTLRCVFSICYVCYANSARHENTRPWHVLLATSRPLQDTKTVICTIRRKMLPAKSDLHAVIRIAACRTLRCQQL